MNIETFKINGSREECDCEWCGMTMLNGERAYFLTEADMVFCSTDHAKQWASHMLNAEVQA